MAMSPYDFFVDISDKKGNLLEQNPNLIKEFNGVSFIVCRALSFHIDSILIVEKLNQQMNMRPESLYNLLSACIRRQRRKWVYGKTDKMDAELEIISRHYGYSREKSEAAHKLLSSDFIKSLMIKYDTGGIGRVKKPKMNKK